MSYCRINLEKYFFTRKYVSERKCCVVVRDILSVLLNQNSYMKYVVSDVVQVKRARLCL